MSNLVISLDFELFWGVAAYRDVHSYRNNIEGVWNAIPQMLCLFRKYNAHVTWATVGMLMCRDYQHWLNVRPSILPKYSRPEVSTYSLGSFVKEYPKLFFARPLVEQILATPGQELATHTYSHFYCGEEGATPEHFHADLLCAQEVASDLGVKFQSIVFPCNQIHKEFLPILEKVGIEYYRGNPDHWLYKHGHTTPAGIVGRAIRYADSWLPVTGKHVAYGSDMGSLTNVPASFFVRPWSRKMSLLEPLRLSRLEQAMSQAAFTGGECHLWWHPHNFGVDLNENLLFLESLLKHFRFLSDQYGMRSITMKRPKNSQLNGYL